MGRLCICMCGGASLCRAGVGGLRAAVWRCVSNSFGAWVAMVLLGVAGFLRHATHYVTRNTIEYLEVC